MSSEEKKADILIVEDDDSIARLIELHLKAAGLSTSRCADGNTAMEYLQEGQWRLVVLDRMLPGTGGMQILRWLNRGSVAQKIPVLMVTALGIASERVQGLNEGADDYLAKPFEPDELVARVKALLRRAANTAAAEAGATGTDIELDPDALLVKLGTRKVELRPMEYRLLAALMEKPGKTRSREYLLDHVWGHDVYVEPRTVDVTIKRLRKAMQTLGREESIQTVRGMGYRFQISA
jgi:two-component system phosphate regulon response regulator PhoB